MSRIASASEKERAQSLIRLGRLDGSELSVMDMIIMSYDGQEEIEEPWFVLVKLRRTLLSENFHTPMGSSHCWLYAAV